MNIRIEPTGELIKNYMVELGINQKTLASEAGCSEKQISLILRGKALLNRRVAEACARLFEGTSVDFWLLYEKKYQDQVANEKRELEARHYKEIDAKLNLDKLFAYSDYSKIERLNLLSDVWETQDLLTHIENKDRRRMRAAFLRDKPDANLDIIEPWVDVVLYIQELGGSKPISFKGVNYLRKMVDADLKMVLRANTSESFEANVTDFCQEAGINILFARNIPSSYIRGMTFSKSGYLYIMLTDRYKSIDMVSFAFVHELMHILNGDIRTDEEHCEFDSGEFDVEEKATSDALSFLLGDVLQETKKQIESGSVSLSQAIIDGAAKANINPGILVTVLQHDGVIDYASQRHFLRPYRVTADPLI